LWGTTVSDPAAELKRFAYFGGSLVLDSVWSYLVGPYFMVAGQSLPPAGDLVDLRARRAVAAALLPDDPAEYSKFFRLCLAMLDQESDRPIGLRRELSLGERIR